MLNKGEEALRIVIVPELSLQMIADASQNVGLLQRIAERFCFLAGILETVNESIARTLGEKNVLQEARKAICKEEAARYRQFGEALSHGFKANEESELKVYRNIAKCAIEASDEELRNGLHYNVIYDRVSKVNTRIRRSDLTAALQRLNRLQQDRQVSPLVLSYNDQTRELQLVDRELLFYRKYGAPVWPWSDEADENDDGQWNLPM